MPQATVSDDPTEITRWRGEPLAERSAWNTVVIGDARGPLEAGLRSFDRTMPEVVNRILVDPVSAWCFVHSPEAVGQVGAPEPCHLAERGDAEPLERVRKLRRGRAQAQQPHRLAGQVAHGEHQSPARARAMRGGQRDEARRPRPEPRPPGAYLVVRYDTASLMLREKHLQAYLDEVVFRFNRRRTPHAAFDRLLGLGLTLQPATYQMLIARS